MRSYLASLLLAAAASAAMIDVAVGEGGLRYTPDTVTAAEGDVIRFMWSGSTTHNVVSGDFSSPCQPNNMIAAPKQSGGDPSFFVQINSTDPIFIYCSVFDHCNEGMVMAINPSSDQTLDTYSSGAQRASVGQPSAQPEGGILAASTATPFASPTGASGSSPTPATTSSSTTSNTDNAAVATGAPAVAVGAAAIGFAAMLL